MESGGLMGESTGLTLGGGGGERRGFILRTIEHWGSRCGTSSTGKIREPMMRRSIIEGI